MYLFIGGPRVDQGTEGSNGSGENVLKNKKNLYPQKTTIPSSLYFQYLNIPFYRWTSG